MIRMRLDLALLGLGVALVFSGVAHAQAPASGSCALSAPIGLWQVNANGHSGWLYFGTIDAAGNITSATMTLSGQSATQVRGFWSTTACKITFYRVNSATTGPPASMQTYTGHMYPVSSLLPAGQRKLAGEFHTYSPAAGGTAARSFFGWDAIR